MFKGRLIGWKRERRKLRWIEEHWPEIREFAMVRAAERYAELLKVDRQHLMLVKVVSGPRVFYGVSLEPPLEEQLLSNLDRELLFVVPGAEADALVLFASEHNPYTNETLPVAPRGEAGFLMSRFTTEDERDEVIRRNLDVLGNQRLTALPGNTRVDVTMDAAYNQIRAEFGMADGRAPRVWRPALKKLLADEFDDIVGEVADVMMEGKLPARADAEFVLRSEEWIDHHQDFMLMIAR